MPTTGPAEADAPAPPKPRRPSPAPAKPGWVGPLFKWELVRLARRGQDARARFFLAGSLLLVLTVFTICYFPHVPPGELFFGTAQVMTITESANFAERFALSFLLAQLGVLVLLTPAYAAGGIAEEKERQTYPYLLVSDLRDREIVFGKFLGRLVFLLGVMLAGLPVLTLTLMFGGVSLNLVLMGYFLTSTTVTLLAAAGVASAAHAKTFRGALFRSYGWAAIHTFFGCGMHPILSPFMILLWLADIEGKSFSVFVVSGLTYGGVQLLFALLAVHIAVKGVRRSRITMTRPPRRRDPREGYRPTQQAAPEPLKIEDAPPADTELPTAKVLPAPVQEQERPRLRHKIPEAIRNRPPVNEDNPFLWKETHVLGSKRDADDESIRGLFQAIGVIVGLGIAFFVFLAAMIVLASGGGNSLWFAERVLIVCGSAGLFTYLLMIGTSACATVCRERQRLTLESLLTIPVDRRQILGPKWRTSLTRGWWWGMPAAACIPLGMLASEVPILAVPTALYLLMAIPAAVSYGLLLSVRSNTITRAILWYLPGAGVVLLLPIVAYRSADFSNGLVVATVLTIAAGIMLTTTVVLWRRACADFEREGRW